MFGKKIKKYLLKPVCCLLAAFAAMLLASVLIIDLQTRGMTSSEIDAMPHYQTGLVLGSPKRVAGGAENLFFTHRINAAIALYRAGKVDYLLVSGDNFSKGCYETRAMREDLIKAGIPAERIYCDYRGMRTLDSVVRAGELFGQREMIIISQEFHNRRALFLAKQKGITAFGFNARDVDTLDAYLVRIRELLADLRSVLDVYVWDTQPRFSGEKVSIDSSSRSNCTY